MSRALVRSGAILAGPALVLAILPGMGAQTTDCGPLDCALVQAAGKILVCVAFFLFTAAFLVRGIALRSWATVGIAAVVMFPSLVYPFLIVQTYQDLTAGTGEVHQMVQAARTYAAASISRPLEDLEGLAIDGKPGWAAVRITDRTEGTWIVVLRSSNRVWSPQAIAPRFDRDALRALGAPTDLIRNQG